MATDFQFSKADPQLRDLFDSFGRQVSQNLNCHIVGQVESFDKNKNTITASVAFKKQFSDGTIAEFPLFADVPIITLSGGSSFLSMPIKKGDWCLLLFCDRDIDNWWYSGEKSTPNTPRLHSFSDAIALVGLKPANEAFELSDTQVTLNASDLPLSLKNDNAELKIGSSGKTKLSNANADFKTILVSIIDEIKNLNIDPATYKVLAPNLVTLELVKTKIGLLLE